MKSKWINIKSEAPSIDGFVRAKYVVRKEGLIKRLYDGRYIDADYNEVEPVAWLKYIMEEEK